MVDDSKHFVNAPADLRHQAAEVLDAAHKAAKADKLGRIDWTQVSTKMAAWWSERGFHYP